MKKWFRSIYQNFLLFLLKHRKFTIFVLKIKSAIDLVTIMFVSWTILIFKYSSDKVISDLLINISIAILFPISLVIDYKWFEKVKYSKYQALNLFFVLSSLFIIPKFVIDLFRDLLQGYWNIIIIVIVLIFVSIVNRNILLPVFKFYKIYPEETIEILITLVLGIGWSAIFLRNMNLLGPYDPVDKFYSNVPLALTMLLTRLK